MSLSRVEIRADGGHGVTRRGYTSQALVRHAGTFHGVDALPAQSGSNAGSIRVELRRRGGVGMQAYDLSNRLSRSVSVGQDLHLSARGGNGDDGGIGGDGQTGTRGYDGRDATQTSDATRGGDGGPGGNGGHGSHGGHGGHGGIVEVRMTEEDVHLAYVIDWDVSGGRGGRAGQHGRGGAGGAGGRGGSGISWKEFEGYRQVCGSDCGSGGSSTAMVRSSGGSLQSGVPLMLAIANGAITDGTNTRSLNNTLAYIPAEYNSVIRGALGNSGSSGLMIEGSGSGGGHGASCRQVADYSHHSRPSASSGSRGPSGYSPTSPLYPGNPGDPGQGSFVVFDRYAPLAASTYTSKFEFKLQDFVVKDENEDDIFEPGECVLVSSIKVQNPNFDVRGMPTPSRTLIPATVRPCAWLQNVVGRDEVHLPRDIAPAHSKTTNDETIWATIQSPSSTSIANQVFTAQQQIKLVATIPDIQREVRNFDHTKDIVIKYPLFMEPKRLKYLDSIPFGSTSSIKWPISNCSSKPLGRDSSCRRKIKASVSTRSDHVFLGEVLLHVPSLDQRRVEEEILRLDPFQTRELSKRMRVSGDAEEYTFLNLSVKLRATPVSSAAVTRASGLSLTLMQSQDVRIQVSNRYRYTSDSNILILTSKATTKQQLDGWRRFIREELHASADVFNASRYGGFQESSNDPSVFTRYVGKTILALDDPFDFQLHGSRTCFEFLPSRETSKETSNGTCFLFARKSKPGPKEVVKGIDRIAAFPLHKRSTSLHAGMISTNTKKQFFNLVKNGSAEMQTYALAYPNSTHLAWRGRRLARRLRKLHPRDRFLVTNNLDDSGLVIIQCIPQGQNFTVAATGVRNESRDFISGLSLCEAYNLVAALPFETRLTMLHDHSTSRQTYSDFVVLACKQSAMLELHEQVSCLANRSRWSHNLFNFKKDRFTTHSLLGNLHDKVGQLLAHDICVPTGGLGSQELSVTALELLSSVVMSSRCQNLKQLMKKIMMPFRRTRSHIKRGLLNRIKRHMDAAVSPGDAVQAKECKDRFNEFKKSVRQKLSKKDRGLDIANRISALTHGQVKYVVAGTSKKAPMRRSHAYSIDDTFSKTRYLLPDEVQKWQDHYQEVEAQQRRDMQLVADLEAELDLEVDEETLPSAAPAPIAASSRFLPAITPGHGLQEMIAGEVAASPVTAPVEMRTAVSSVNEDTALVSPLEMRIGATPPIDGPISSPIAISPLPFSPVEPMSTSLIPELPGDSDPVWELLRRSSPGATAIVATSSQATNVASTPIDNELLRMFALFLAILQHGTESDIPVDDVD